MAAYQPRGVSFLVAVTFAAEVGDVRRFSTPRQLMAFRGLVPSERTAGDTVRRGSITKTGNTRAPRVLGKIVKFAGALHQNKYRETYDPRYRLVARPVLEAAAPVAERVAE